MKKKIILAAATAALLLTGCNTTAPSERVDRDGNITINMNFKQVKKAYTKALYDGKLGYQHIYYQWLEDNRERVNPFFDLEKWRIGVEKQYQKDEKMLKQLQQQGVDTLQCHQLLNSLHTLLPIYRRSGNSKEVAELRSKIGEQMKKIDCKSISWKREIIIQPKNDIEFLMEID